MHEATVAKSILDLVAVKLQNTPEASAAVGVQVAIGEFRNVDFDSLQFAFDNLKQDYRGCGECVLHPTLIQAVASCHVGRHNYHPEMASAFACNQCASGIGKLISGTELDVIGITLEARNTAEDDNNARISR